MWWVLTLRASSSNRSKRDATVSASEAIRDALRLLKEHEELREMPIKALRRQIQEGKESGPGIPADKVFDRLEEKYSKLISEP